MRVSEHAAERAKERAGLSLSAVTRLATRALERGVRPKDVSGNARAWLDRLSLEHRSSTVVYGAFAFVFGHHNTLITLFQVPNEFKPVFLKAAKRKEAA